jgi:HemK-related putative methylase
MIFSYVMPIYEPREDSYLLQKYVKKYAYGNVLDIGTGSGIQAETAAKKKNVTSVLAVDIDEEVLSSLKKKKLSRKVTVKKSDLFSHVSGTFDTIIFNPPYLPQDRGMEDSAIYGGKRGFEILERFLTEVGDHLTERGIVLIVFSSLTNKENIDAIIAQQFLESQELERQHLFFEELYCYRLMKSPLLRKLHKKGMKRIRYFSRGKRGIISVALYRGRTVAIKTKRPESVAERRVENEARWLRILNKKGIGPQLLFAEPDVLAYYFVEGEFLPDFIEHHAKKSIISVLTTILNQCFMLDQLGVQKEEMHRPYKHIIVGRNNTVTMLDFERCYRTSKPHNVTQFVEFICRIRSVLVRKGFSFTTNALRMVAKEYSMQKTEDHVKNIISALRSK